MKQVLVWIILCLIWGSTWIFIKIGLEDIPPFAFAAARFILAIAVLLPLLLIQGVRIPRAASEWRLIALTGVLQFSVNYSLVFWSEVYITSGLAAVLQAMITVFGLILAWIFLPSEKITLQKLVAVAIGIAGVATIFIDQLQVQSLWAFLGSVGIVVGAYAAAQASILVKARGSELHPASLVLWQMICGTPAIILYSLAVEGDPRTFNWSWKAIACITYLAVAGTIAAFWLYYWLLRRIESTKAMMISLVTPLIAVLVGWVVLGETLPKQTGFGGLLILGSIGLIVFRRRRKDLRDEAQIGD